MNMISTGAFLTEMDASSKKDELVSKLVAAWEKKNSKVARAGGVSLMALSLAACGSSSDTTSTETATETTTVTPTPDPVGESYALTDSAVTTKNDAFTGTSNDDTYTGDKDTIEAGDIILDQGGANDTANLTFNDDLPALTLSGIENVNITINEIAATAAQTVTAANFSGVTNLTVTKGDVVVGGSTISGNKAIVINNVDASDVAKITTAGTTTTVNITQATKAGVVVDADNASGNVTVVGAATVNAAGAGTGDTVTVQALNDATEDAKDVSITTNAAVVNTTANTLNFTGNINVNAPSAIDVNLASATGGATIVAKGDDGTSGTDGIVVAGVDASGVNITTSHVGIATGTAGATATEGEIQITGTAATTDAATISAIGATNLDIDTTAVENVTLSGNGAAVTYNIVDVAATTYTGTGSHDVNLAGNESKFSGTTITGIATLDLNAGTAGAVDLSLVDATTIDVGFDNAGDKGGTELPFTVKSGASFLVTANQTDMIVNFGATETSANLNITAGDVNGAANTAVGTLNLVDLDINSALAGNVAITANDANFTTNTLVVGAKQTVTLSGDEDYTLGTVTAKSVDGSDATGKISATSTTSALTFTTGAGADTMTINGDAVHVIATGAGADTIDINDTKDASSFDAGAGNDVVIVDAAGGIESIVVTLGDGDDIYRTDKDSDAIVVGGAGSDTLDVDAAINFSDNTNFSISAMEKIDIAGAGGTVTLSAAQLAGNSTLSIVAAGSDDILQVTMVAAAGGAIDGSNLTLASGSAISALSYTGIAAKADTITGGVMAETFNFTTGGDSIEGGSTGVDTFVMGDTTLNAAALGVVGSATSTGAVINLGSTAVSGTTIYAATSQYTGSNAEVAAGSSTHVYAANATTNSTEVTNISGIENVTGGDGIDYIVGTGGNNTLVGGAGGDTILGGDGVDTITGGTGDDTMTGGNGVDIFTFASGDISAAPSATVFDTITDYSGDTIDLDVAITIGANANAAAATAAAIAADGEATFHAADDTLAEVIVALEGGINAGGTAADGQLAFGEFGGNSYVFISDGTDGVGANDIVIKLTGVTGLDSSALSGGNIIIS